MTRINIAKFIGGTKNCYSDYEELAFMNGKRVWVQHVFEHVKDIGGAFGRDKDDTQSFVDLVFYCSVHCVHAYVETKGRISKETISYVVEAVAYTLDLIQTNDDIVKSSIDWSDPDAYANWVQQA